MKKMLVQGDSLFLPNEVITNILKRLPVKTLTQFQCVSKFWKNLVRSPYFIADHLHHTSNQSPRLLFNRGGYDPLNLFVVDHAATHKLVQLQKPSFMSKLRRTRIINSCNGLICVRSDSDASSSGTSLFIWNPATQEVRWVPGVSDGDVDGVLYFGFGFSPILNDYKIVKIFMSNVNKQVEVYSLNTDTWREIEFRNTEIGRISHHGQANFNGSIFWVAQEMNGIVSFDLASEVFTLMPVPGLYIKSHDLRVLELNKKLVLVGYTENERYKSSIHYWEMEEVVNVSDKKWSWTKIDKNIPCIPNLYIRQVLFYVESLVYQLPILNVKNLNLKLLFFFMSHI